MKIRSTETTVISDDMIVELYFQRDERAIKETDIKYKGFLLSIAYNILFDTEDCKECLNDTYIATWNAIPPTKPTLLQAFLATIMRRTAIDRYKTNNRQKRIPSRLTSSLSELEDLIASNEDGIENANGLSHIISDFLRSLTRREMYIFMSRYYFARPIDEIARHLHHSKSTVSKELALIRHQLKERLESEGYKI